MSLHLAKISGALAIAFSVCTLVAPAKAAEPERGAMAACGADLAKFCAGVEAGGGKKIRCLADNRTGLSQGCVDALAARQDRRGTVTAQAQPAAPTTPGAAVPGQSSGQPSGNLPPAAATPAPPAAALPKAAPLAANMRACRTDMATFCGSVEKGGGRRVKCLMENQAKLSPDCSTAISGAQAQKQAAQESCTADIAKFCPTAKGPARRQCLDANMTQLSPACANLLAARAAKQVKRAATPQKP